MRTKSFLAAAALVAAGVLSSEAQSNVYSLNVVGYVNLTLKPGYNLITPQLKDASGSTSINVLLTNAPALADGSSFFGWNAGLQTFTEADIWVQAENTWYLSDGSAVATDTSPRGKAYFIQNVGATPATLTLVGEVPQGQDVGTVPNNYGFLGDYVPMSGEIKTNGFPIANGANVFTFDSTTQSYTEALIGDTGTWYLSDGSAEATFAPKVGEGFIHFTTAGAANWTRNFTVK